MAAPSQKPDLDAAFHDALQRGRYSDGPIFLGTLEDFDPEVVKASALKFVVRDGNLWITHTNSTVHGEASSGLAVCLLIEFLKRCNPEHALELIGSTNVDFGSIPSLFGCTAKQGKNFDAYLRVQQSQCSRYHPLVACEISFRHENFPLLLEEGLSAVSKFTDAAFSLLIDLVETKRFGEIKKVNDIRVLLLERTSNFASETGLLDTATKRHCRKSLPADLDQVNPKLYPEVKVLHDQTFSREEILKSDFECTIKFPTDMIAKYLGSEDWFTGVTVDVSLGAFFLRIITNVDHLVSIGQYPGFWLTRSTEF